MAKNSKFGAAFKAAKAAGKKEFSFGGKKYNTKEAPSAPKNGPTPTPRPASPSEASTAGRQKLAASNKSKAMAAKSTPSLPAKSGTGTKPKPTAVPKAKAAIAAIVGAVTKKETQSPSSPSRKAYEKSKAIADKKAAMGPPAPTMAQKAAEKSTVGKSPIAVKNQANKKK
jgi:hypothetical protein